MKAGDFKAVEDVRRSDDQLEEEQVDKAYAEVRELNAFWVDTGNEADESAQE